MEGSDTATMLASSCSMKDGADTQISTSICWTPGARDVSRFGELRICRHPLRIRMRAGDANERHWTLPFVYRPSTVARKLAYAHNKNVCICQYESRAMECRGGAPRLGFADRRWKRARTWPSRAAGAGRLPRRP